MEQKPPKPKIDPVQVAPVTAINIGARAQEILMEFQKENELGLSCQKIFALVSEAKQEQIGDILEHKYTMDIPRMHRNIDIEKEPEVVDVEDIERYFLHKK